MSRGVVAGVGRGVGGDDEPPDRRASNSAAVSPRNGTGCVRSELSAAAPTGWLAARARAANSALVSPIMGRSAGLVCACATKLATADPSSTIIKNERRAFMAWIYHGSSCPSTNPGAERPPAIAPRPNRTPCRYCLIGADPLDKGAGEPNGAPAFPPCSAPEPVCGLRYRSIACCTRSPLVSA